MNGFLYIAIIEPLGHFKKYLSQVKDYEVRNSGSATGRHMGQCSPEFLKKLLGGILASQ